MDFVAGRNRVPSPATGMTAFETEELTDEVTEEATGGATMEVILLGVFG